MKLLKWIKINTIESTQLLKEYNCPFAVLYEIFKPDHKPVTVMLPVDASVNDILTTLVDPERDYVLVKMNSSGGKLWDYDDLGSESPLKIFWLCQNCYSFNIRFCPTWSDILWDQSFFCFLQTGSSSSWRPRRSLPL